MFVFYDWPFAHVYYAQNVAYFPLILGSVFSECVVFYWELLVITRMMVHTGRSQCFGVESDKCLTVHPSRTQTSAHCLATPAAPAHKLT